MAPTAASSDKALAAILPLIAAGSAYEAHQKARTFASRYVKANAYDTAIQVLFQSSRELLKAGHYGSGTDLGLFLIDVYNTKEQEVDDTSRGYITQLIALTGPEGTWRKTLIDKAVAWSAEFSSSPSGDPSLQRYIGDLLYKEGSFDLAEPHFLASGDRDSAKLLANMMAKWVPHNESPGAFATRGVIPFLLVQNILAARTFLAEFISILVRTRPLLIEPSPITISSDEIHITTDPTINFLQLAIRACQRGNGESTDHQREARNTWVRLYMTYKAKSSIIGSSAMNQAAITIGNLYFGIPLPRQAGNPLQDMMASLFGGGPSAQPTRGAIRGRGRGVVGLD